jgi:hypothetical protein
MGTLTASILDANLIAGVLLGAFVGWVVASAFAWLALPRVKHYGFLERIPAYDGGHLHKLWFELLGPSAPGVCSIELTYGDLSRFAKWDEAGAPLTWNGAFWPDLVPSTSMQVLHLGRVYSVPIVYERDGQYQLFSGWWYGRRQAPTAAPILDPDASIRIALTGHGLKWTREFKIKDLCAGPAVEHAESDAHQGVLRGHVDRLAMAWSPLRSSELPTYACGSGVSRVRRALRRRRAR